MGLDGRREFLLVGHISLTLASATDSGGRTRNVEIYLVEIEPFGELWKWKPYVPGYTSLEWNFCITELGGEDGRSGLGSGTRDSFFFFFTTLTTFS